MTTLVDKLVEHGIPIASATEYVEQVFGMNDKYTYEQWLTAFPLEDIPAMMDLKEMINQATHQIDIILTQNHQRDIVKWFLLTGYPLKETGHFPRIRADMECVMSTNPYFV